MVRIRSDAVRPGYLVHDDIRFGIIDDENRFPYVGDVNTISDIHRTGTGIVMDGTILLRKLTTRGVDYDRSATIYYRTGA